MNKKVLVLLITGFAVVYLNSCAQQCAQPPKKFVSLFNGKDLTGWTGAVDGYYVEDGKLICRKTCQSNLFTKKEYSNFSLRFEFKFPSDAKQPANNGIGIRAPLEGRASRKGMEIQVLDDIAIEKAGVHLKPYQYHGSIYGVVPAKRGHLKPTGKWNFEEITANGRQITVKLNGTIIVDANLDEIKPMTGEEHPGLKREKGHIGFLGHNARVEFRNIRLAELP